MREWSYDERRLHDPLGGCLLRDVWSNEPPLCDVLLAYELQLNEQRCYVRRWYDEQLAYELQSNVPTWCVLLAYELQLNDGWC